MADRRARGQTRASWGRRYRGRRFADLEPVSSARRTLLAAIPGSLLIGGTTGAIVEHYLARRAADGRESGVQSTAGTPMRGVGIWPHEAASLSLRRSGARWFHTWHPTARGIAAPSGVEFVPAIRDPSQLSKHSFDEITASPATCLLGFNEPDRADQADMTVSAALDAWPQLEATGRRLGSPAVAANPATPGSWLDQFMTGAVRRSHRVDFIACHWYGWAGSINATAEALCTTLQAVHDRYQLPIWLTEFAAVPTRNGLFVEEAAIPPAITQAAFLAFVTAMIEASLSDIVERTSWFSLSAAPGLRPTALYNDDGSPTELGQVFQIMR